MNIGVRTLRDLKNSVTKDKQSPSAGLLQLISDLFEGRAELSDLPDGVEKIERVTAEAVRLKLKDEVDQDLLAQIAKAEGYSVDGGSVALRVVKEGAIVARAGSTSDVGGRFDLYVYLFPPELEKMNMYRQILAEHEGILDPHTSKIDVEKSLGFNLAVI